MVISVLCKRRLLSIVTIISTELNSFILGVMETLLILKCIYTDFLVMMLVRMYIIYVFPRCTVEREIFARYIIRVLCDLTEFAKVYPTNLLISQYKRIIPARKLRN